MIRAGTGAGEHEPEEVKGRRGIRAGGVGSDHAGVEVDIGRWK